MLIWSILCNKSFTLFVTRMSMEKLYIWIYVYIIIFTGFVLLNLRIYASFIQNIIFHPANRINTIIGLQGIFQLKRLTLHYMNNDQRRTKQEKVETKIFSETPAMCVGCLRARIWQMPKAPKYKLNRYRYNTKTHYLEKNRKTISQYKISHFSWKLLFFIVFVYL